MRVPVLVVTYSRINHLQNLISSLEKCSLADETDLWVCSDAPKSKGDEKIVNEIRSYVTKIRGFASCNYIFREKNLGPFENFRSAYLDVARKYGRCIVMEDDLEVSPDYLKFMNKAMDFYENNDSVVSVCGYLDPKVDGLSENIFFMRRRSPYGSGIWYEKELKIRKILDSNVSEIFIKDANLFFRYQPFGVNLRSLPLIHQRDLMAGDIEVSMLMFLMGLLSVYPPVSLVCNRGNDGSGIHAGFNKILQLQKYKSLPDVILDQDLSKVTPINNLKIEVIHSKSKRFIGETFLNHAIYFTYKFFPTSYVPYCRIRKIIKNLRRRLSGLD